LLHQPKETSWAETILEGYARIIPCILQTQPNHSYTFLGDPLLIHPSLPPLLGHMHLSIIPSQLTSHFILTFNHNISGIPQPRGGGPNSTMFQPYCLHHIPNHNYCTLLNLRNPICGPNQIQTQAIGRFNKDIVDRHHTQLML